MDNKTGNSDRVFYLDICRIVATFFIVLLHAASGKWGNTDVHSYEWSVMNMYDGISRWGVPVFVMISGVLFLNREIPIKTLFRKYILRLLVIYYVWSFIYSIVYTAMGGNSLRSFIIEFLSGPGHLWFLFMIIGLYIITPFLRKITENEKHTVYFLLLAFVFAICIPEFISIVTIFSTKLGGWIENLFSKSHIHFMLGYSGYFILGYYLNKKTFCWKTTILINIFGVLGFISTILLTMMISRYRGSAQEVFFNYLTINVLFESVWIFQLLKKVFSKATYSNKVRKVVFILSKYTFGVYLMHVLVLRLLNIVINSFSLQLNVLFSIPVRAIIAFIISLGVSAILNNIPFVRKYLV